jgi:hypothetical protein
MSSRKFPFFAFMALLLAACALPGQRTGVQPAQEAIITATSAASEVEVTLEATSAPTEAAYKIIATQVVEVATATPDMETLALAPLAERSLPRYGKQAGTPVGMPNFIRPEAGCQWLGLGGQVFDSDGAPVSMLIVEIGGALEGIEVLRLTLTGTEAGIGQGSFLIELADHATADSSLWVQVLDLQGVPQSDKIPFSTSADCDKNFTLVNFTQIPAGMAPRMIFPIIYRR